MKNRSLFLLIFVSLLLAACAPQVIATSEVTVTLSPPTETPLPTLTPTPVAVDGIAEDAEGNKLVYLDGEWVALPEFADDQAADVDRVEVQKPSTKDQRIVAFDAEDVELYELSVDGKEWVEVEKDSVILGFNPEVEKLMKKLIEDKGEVPLKPLYKDNGEVLEQGLISVEAGGEFNLISGKYIGMINLADAMPNYTRDGVRLAVIEVERENGELVYFAVGFNNSSPKSSMQHPITFLQGPIAESGFPDTKRQLVFAHGSRVYELLVSELAGMEGQQILVELARPMTPGDDKYEAVQAVLDALDGNKPKPSEMDWLNGVFAIPDNGKRP